MDKSLGTNLHLWRIFTRAKRTARQEFIYICLAPSLPPPPPPLQCWTRVYAISPEVQQCMGVGGGGKATHFETQKQCFFNSAYIILCYSFYFWLIRSFTDPAFTGSIFVCGPLHHHVSLSSIFGAVGLFRSDMLLIFNMVWPWFSCGTVCVCPQCYLIVAMAWYSGFFQLSLVTRFACEIGQLARIWIWVPS